MQVGEPYTCISICQGGETTLLHAPVFMTEQRPNHLPLLMGQPAMPGLSILYNPGYIYYISMEWCLAKLHLVLIGLEEIFCPANCRTVTERLVYS